MAIYSITDLEKLTGIKAHTIRMWEKRYSIITPKRTQSNIRYYDELDLKKISNVAVLNHKGYKISTISEMPSTELEGLLSEFTDGELINNDALDAFTLCILQLDEDKFLHLINKNISQSGFDETFNVLLMPLLDKMHVMWLSGAVKKVHEEFLIQIIKKKLYQQIAQLEAKPSHQIRFLLFLTSFEQQELSSIYAEYHLRKLGFKLIQLSKELNEKEVLDAIQAFEAQFLLSFVQEEKSLEFIEEIIFNTEQMNPKPVFILTGYYATMLQQDESRVRVIHSFQQLDDFVQTLIKLSDQNFK